MTSFEIRELFLRFFERHGHRRLPGSSLLPQNDPSLLFVNAGMNQFKSAFLGLEKPPAQNAATIQKCLRAGGKHNDLDNVGRTPRHHTFFEMMGNFSFGGYFKKGAINLSWEFLTKELRLPESRLWVTVFEDDRETEELWRTEINLPRGRILRLGEKDNFWRMGSSGPCGPCSEIHYYNGPEKKPPPEDLLEFWTLVFMEFSEDERGRRTPLPVKCLDAGMGLERLAAIMQGRDSNYHTDIFQGIIQALEKESGAVYSWKGKSWQQTAFHVLADHGRAAAFLTGAGVLPGNEGRSYALRRILRRGFFYGRRLNPKKNLLLAAARAAGRLMEGVYPELRERSSETEREISKEAEAFERNLREGEKRLLQKMASLSEKFIGAGDVWDLYSSYGLPPDLTRLIAGEKGFGAADEAAVKRHAETIRQKAKSSDSEGDEHKNLPRKFAAGQMLRGQKTLMTCYEKDEDEGHVLWTLSRQRRGPSKDMDAGGRVSTAPLQKGERGWIVLDRTCLYPEGGGPVGDTGMLEAKTGRAKILSCEKHGDVVFHEAEVIEGELKGVFPQHSEKNQQRGGAPKAGSRRAAGEKDSETKCKMKADPHHRRAVRAGHSATHLLHKALRETLGPSVRQAGSLIDAQKLRFDFTYEKPLTGAQIQEAEDRARADIQAQSQAVPSHQTLEEAKKSGALFLAGENYPDKVRVISIGESRELCGGLHVKNSAEIGCLKIISETGAGAGIRRITALTGAEAEKWLSALAGQNLQLRRHLSWPAPAFPLQEKENPFIPLMEKKDREIQSLKKQLARLPSGDSFSPAELRRQARPFRANGLEGLLLIKSLPARDKKALGELADQLKSKIAGGAAGPGAVIVAVGEGRGRQPVAVTVSKSLQKQVSAGDLIKRGLAPLLKGKGGGAARFAQGIITDKARLPELEQKLLSLIQKSGAGQPPGQPSSPDQAS